LLRSLQGIRIRGYRSEDYDEVKALWRQVNLWNFLDVRWSYDRKARENPDLFIVVEYMGKIIGTVYGFSPYLPFSFHQDKLGYIGHLAVHPNWQGKGLGSYLLEEICLRLSRRGKRYVMLFVNFMGKRAGDLYKFYEEKHGFKHIFFIFYKKL